MKTLKLLFLSGFLILFSNTSFSQGACIDSSNINLGAFCPTVIDPVCGCDGVTYNNACEALYWNGVTSWVPGSCGGTSSCNATFTYTMGQFPCDFIFLATGASTYSWDFGDGTAGTGQTALHTYTANGSYNICMYAYNMAGVPCDTVCQYITVTGCGSPCTLTLYDSIIPPSCYNSCDGFADISVSGGSPPYTFAWSNGLTTSYGTNLCCGIYTVSVIDSQGCTGTITIDMDCPAYLELTATSTNESSSGANDGTITALASGGTPSYSYSIDNGNTYQASNIFTGLAGGVYIVYVMDDHGCISFYTVLVEIGGCIDASIIDSSMICPTVFDPVCGCDSVTYNNACEALNWYGVTSWTPGPCNSSCQATFTYTLGQFPCDFIFIGVGASAYSWDFGNGTVMSGQSIYYTFPSNGSYEVCMTAYDANGTVCDTVCQYITVVGCGSPCTLNLYDSIIPPSCTQSCDGYAEISVSGGSPPYTFLWSNGMTGSYSNNLCCGIYTISVTDSQGCIGTITIDMDCPAYLELTATSTNESSSGANDGTITALASGGTPSYMYSIDNGITYQTSNIFTGLAAGVYVVYVMDNHGCISIYTVLVESGNSGCQAIFTSTSLGCTAQFIGAGAYDYWWDFGDGTSDMGTSVTHTYTNDASYYVCMYAYDQNGMICDTVCDYINIMGCDSTLCEADFYPYIDSSCTAYFNNTSIGATSFEWYFGDGNSSTQISPQHTYTDMGPYTVVLVAYDIQGFPCDSVYQTIVLLDCTSGLNENIADFGLEIYPNPTTNSGIVDLTLPMAMNVDVKILSIMGKTADVIYTGHLDSGKQSIQWTNNGLASGIYIIQISTPYGVQKKKLLIQR